MDAGKSPRQQVAENLADTCMCSDLNDVYGVSVSKGSNKNGKTYWVVMFCKSRTLDGVIHVYSPNFIQVKWQTAYRTLPHTGSKVLRSEAEAKQFIIDAFVKRLDEVV